jgi:hypothetical protein
MHRWEQWKKQFGALLAGNYGGNVLWLERPDSDGCREGDSRWKGPSESSRQGGHTLQSRLQGNSAPPTSVLDWSLND